MKIIESDRIVILNVNLAYNSGGHTAHDGEVSNILGHNTAGTHNAMIPDGDTLGDNRMGTDKAPDADCNGGVLVGLEAAG